MADETPEPIADTAAFRAFSSAGQDTAGQDSVGRATQRRPSMLVWVTAVVVLVAMLAAVLATVL
jgi:hypothetical protein